MTVLDVNALSVFYGDIQALWDVSFTVGEGQLVAVLGANGAGKTTTLKTISGLLTPAERHDNLSGETTSADFHPMKWPTWASPSFPRDDNCFLN